MYINLLYLNKSIINSKGFRPIDPQNNLVPKCFYFKFHLEFSKVSKYMLVFTMKVIRKKIALD